MFNADKVLMEKWAPVLEHTSVEAIGSAEKKAITARLLENTELALQEEAAHNGYQLQEAGVTAGDLGASNGSITGADPVLISLIRRAMPNLIAYDVAGVQPMTGPTGLIFAMKSRGGQARNTAATAAAITTANAEILFNEADTDFSGVGTDAGEPTDLSIGANITLAGTGSVLTVGDVYQVKSFGADGIAQAVVDVNAAADQVFTANTMKLGATFVAKNNGDAIAATGTVVVGTIFDISAVTTGTGDTTNNMEVEDQFADVGFTIEKVTVTAKTRALKAQYTMELAQDLKAVHGLDAEAELANIVSTEVLAEINREVIRKINSDAQLATAGLAFRLEQEANAIAVSTRRGKGNFIICSSSVASALAAAGTLDYSGALVSNLNVDNAGNTFAGTLSSGIKVYVDPYAAVDYATVGYKGATSYDAGIFYCPYVPLTMVKAVGENTFQPRIGFKTRYGMATNPMTSSALRQNSYYRIARIANL